MANMTVGSNAFGLDAQLFTRGTGADKDRGESMVVKHLEKLQQEKETLAIQKLSALMPQLGTTVRVLALKEAVFDVETAVNLLKAFQNQNAEELKGIVKKRKKIQDAEAEAVAAAQEEAASSSSSSSSSDSDSDSGRGKKRRRKDSKRSSKDKKRRKEKRSSKGSDRRKSSRHKEDKATPKQLTASEQYGRFGIIRETDAAEKRQEFILWALDVKKADVELLGRMEERELFKDFMEDFNTGTLPHRKYYNLALYEKEREAKRVEKLGKHAAKIKPTPADDEAAMRRAREEERARLAAERQAQALAELKATDKARDMREQEMLRLEMQAAYKRGDTRKAHQIQQLLMTDDEKRAKGIIK